METLGKTLSLLLFGGGATYWLWMLFDQLNKPRSKRPSVRDMLADWSLPFLMVALSVHKWSEWGWLPANKDLKTLLAFLQVVAIFATGWGARYAGWSRLSDRGRRHP